MQKLIQKQKGAISIFLVIILLPMLTLGCTMVDLARISSFTGANINSDTRADRYCSGNRRIIGR